MARKLDVYLNDVPVGTLLQNNYGEIEFQYSTPWLTNPKVIALSQSLPLRAEQFSRRECGGFFGGVLPEGEKREIIARNLGITAHNDVKMLELIGGECAGAITFMPDGESLPSLPARYQPQTEQELAGVLRDLPRRPLLAGERHIRLSLAGAQDKLAVYIDGAQICLPLDGAPSTHILKPSLKDHPGLVLNELLCMNLANAIGLPTARAARGISEDTDYLLVERYDRIRTDGRLPERLHQEDFCQALGIASDNKYQNEGGPSIQQSFQLLRNAGSVPALDVTRLLDAVVYNFLIGNNDAHGKNFSLLYQQSSRQSWTTSFAPLYDLICTAYYPELSSKMAMKIGGEYDPTRVFPHHFDRLADEAGLNKPAVRRRVQSLAKAILVKLPEVTSEDSVSVGVARLIREQCDRTLVKFRK